MSRELCKVRDVKQRWLPEGETKAAQLTILRTSSFQIQPGLGRHLKNALPLVPSASRLQSALVACTER
jgi:hypothetical protein